MSAIGPELPPHLLNRPSSSSNEYKDDRTDVAGPQLPSKYSTNETIPQGDEDEDNEDDYGPALPPDMAASRSAGPSSGLPAATSAKRVVGPSMPSYPPTYDQNFTYDEEEDDDDDFGPKPLPAGMQHAETDAVKQFMEKEEKRRKEVEEAAKPKKMKRDEWMLVPPTSSDLLGALDPTKLKARQFSRSAAPARKDTDNSLWTETPAERQQRLADEVSGKKRRAVDNKPDPDEGGQERRKKRRDEEVIRKGVDEYTNKIRGPALIAQHASSQSSLSAPKDPKENMTWDHGRDMSLGGRLMDDEKRNKFVQEAKGLGDRFGTGKSGGFL